MLTEITIALIALVGTVIGSGGGILASSKLTNHRIKCLEEKVNKHNCIIERTFILETKQVANEARLNKLED